MIAAGNRGAVVRTLSVRGSGLDAVSARLRAEEMLGGVELRPPSLPPSAILCVRRLRDPRPGALALDGRGQRPPQAWADALTAALESIVRRAAHPWHGAVPAAAEAVIFADRSELLACLAADAMRGELGARWWWTSLLPDARATRAAVTAWTEAPAHVPGALRLLAERGEATAFVSALAVEEVRAIARAVADRFAVPALVAIEAAGRAASPAPAVASTAPVPTAAAASSTASEAPWRQWTPDRASGALDGERGVLLGFGLGLSRAPDVVRSMTFAAAVTRWREATVAAVAGPEVPATRTAPSAVAAVAPSVAPLAGDNAKAAVAADAGDRAPRAPAGAPRVAAHDAIAPSASPDATPAVIETDVEPRRDARPASGPDEIAAPEVRARSAWSEPPSDGVIAAPAPSMDDVGPPGPAPAAPLPPAAPASDERPLRRRSAPVETERGGLFFLVNLGLYLDLYGDFSTPLTPGIELPIWDFVALVGRDLLDDEPAPADPVWALLADLAGRQPDESPGHRFDPPDDWRVPGAWLRPFPSSTPCRWTAANGRLAIRHPAGFTIVDVPTAPDVDGETHAHREAAAYGALTVAPAPSPAPSAPAPERGLARWIGHLMPYVRVRLARAFGPAAGAAPGRLLCAVPARVHVTPSHVDVAMALTDLSIEVRLAGLDRDPGWLPGAGRYLAFHFSAASS